MPEPSEHREAASDWAASLDRSKAQIAAGQTVPLLPVLERLREAAEALEARLHRDPDGAATTDR